MKTIKTSFSRKGILVLLAINWLAVIMITNCPIAEQASPKSNLWVLIIAFILQFAFLSDQLKKYRNPENKEQL